MKNNHISEKGVSMISLVITIIILVILVNVLVYNAKDSVYVQSLTNLYNDLEVLRDKTNSYYNEYGKIPAKIKYSNTDNLTKVLSKNNDTGEFYVIDLEAMQGISLNYGKDYEKIKTDESAVNTYDDVYIINENSHNIFYVKGIKVKNNEEITTYYTDYLTPDETIVEQKYIDGILIPDDCSYIGKEKDNSGNESIVIEKNENQYIWQKQVSSLKQIPDSIKLDANQKKEDFLESVNVYKGYFKNKNKTEDIDIIYLDLYKEKWSEAYTKDTLYTDINGDTANIPKGYKVSMSPAMNTVINGLVIKDENDNEFVWIEVPKTVFKFAQNDTDYQNIEKDLIIYTEEYRVDGFQDVWNSGMEITKKEYEKQYETMLSSVYNNNGFWIGRYECGVESPRTKTSTEDTNIKIKKDIYPYNFVTQSEAINVIKKFANEQNMSLIYGIQWDLTCKFIESNSQLGKSDLIEDSSEWSNIPNAKFIVENENAKYNEYSEKTGFKGWNSINTQYNKNGEILFTTGASNRNKILNIYDFAGNGYELTQETYTKAEDENSVVYRGGCFNTISDNGPAVTRAVHNKNDKEFVGSAFRITLY